jgi:hypothetical protein
MTRIAVWAGDDLEVHPVLTVLAGVKRPVGGDPVDGDNGLAYDRTI